MKLVVRNRQIDAPVVDILKAVQAQCNSKVLKDIRDKGSEVICSCPFHKNGQELHASCSIVNDSSRDIEYGTFHCFTCKESGPLIRFIQRCLDLGNVDYQAETWLIDNFANTWIDAIDYLPEIDLSQSTHYLNESILDSFKYDNKSALQYLLDKRRLKKEVVNYFKIGFDTSDNCITFPCWDIKGNLVGIFKRSIYSKFFVIPEISPKPVYLLNEIIKNGYTQVAVCESQINALTLWSWGIPAVALFGTGTAEQYKLLNKSGIRNYLLVFDGDPPGRNGRNKFINNCINSSLISYVDVPEGKDVNDLTFNEFCSLGRYDV